MTDVLEKYDTDELKQEIEEIEQAAKYQVENILPNTSSQNKNSEENFDKLLRELHDAKNINENLKIEIAKETAKTDMLEQQRAEQQQRLQVIMQVGDSLQEELNEGTANLSTFVCKHEKACKELGDTFRNAPALYETAVLKAEVDEDSKIASKLGEEILAMEEKIKKMREAVRSSKEPDLSLASLREITSSHSVATDEVIVALEMTKRGLEEKIHKISDEIAQCRSVHRSLEYCVTDSTSDK